MQSAPPANTEGQFNAQIYVREGVLHTKKGSFPIKDISDVGYEANNANDNFLIAAKAIPLSLIACWLLFAYVGASQAYAAFIAFLIIIPAALFRNQNCYLVAGGVKQRIFKAPSKVEAEKLASFVRNYTHANVKNQ